MRTLALHNIHGGFTDRSLLQAFILVKHPKQCVVDSIYVSTIKVTLEET
jgi:hypothetical protein